jgi:ABC-type multidrug transport system ATPase subunit
VLRAEGIAASSGVATLTFNVPDGRCVGLLGRDLGALLPLAECASGIRVPFAGRVLVDDFDVARDRDRAQPRIAVGLARAAHHLTSLGEHAAAVAGSRPTRMTTAEGIARLGLDARTRLDTPAARSAAAVLAALLPDASVVILHDPFSHLDGNTRAKAIEWIRSLSESGAAVLVTGTEERDVRAVSHSVIELGGGG